MQWDCHSVQNLQVAVSYRPPLPSASVQRRVNNPFFYYVLNLLGTAPLSVHIYIYIYIYIYRGLCYVISGLRSDSSVCQAALCTVKRRRNRMTYSCKGQKSIPDFFMFRNSLSVKKRIETRELIIHDTCYIILVTIIFCFYYFTTLHQLTYLPSNGVCLGKWIMSRQRCWRKWPWPILRSCLGIFP
jgi:hypothetical protein